jgi:hypothetical protein
MSKLLSGDDQPLLRVPPSIQVSDDVALTCLRNLRVRGIAPEYPREDLGATILWQLARRKLGALTVRGGTFNEEKEPSIQSWIAPALLKVHLQYFQF